MTLYLRNKLKQSVLEVEIYDNNNSIELNSSVNIEFYSYLLLEYDNKTEMISDFEFLSELRGWFWEFYYNNTENIELKKVKREVKEILTSIGKKYNLFLVED